MLLSDIDRLLPHRAPFQLVDDILVANHDEIIGVKTYDQLFFLQGHFPALQMVPGVILIESMAQCGGAGVNQMGLAGDGLWGLATVEKARFFGIVKPGKTVRIVVKNLKISDKVIKQSGVVICDGRIIAKASWMCLKFFNSIESKRKSKNEMVEVCDC
jgi:3-hydroxyacyl-[acyl-carrier-protein] dehydratase